MSNKYNTTYIGDISNINANSYSSSENWEYVNYLDTGNITKNKIDEIQYIDLSVDKLPSRAKRKVIKNSIIYSTVRPNQQHFGFIDKQPENFLVSTGFAVIDINPDIANPKFVYYYLTQDKITEGLHALAEQSVSAYPSIKPSDVGNVKIFLPDLTTQEKIAKVLSSLDDKIELNNKINQNLEQQAQAIFKSWFVDFENPKRKTCKAEDYFNISIGKTPPRKEPEWFSQNSIDKKWISISDMGNCGVFILNSSEYLKNSAIDKFNIVLVPKDTVILSFKLTVGRVAITNEEMTTNEAIAHFKTDNKKIKEYLYCYLKNYNFQTMGSTSSIATAVNSKIIKSMPFIIPTDDEIENFHQIMKFIFEKIRINQIENEKLTQLRDTLLPKLMSGEIDVDKVEV